MCPCDDPIEIAAHRRGRRHGDGRDGHGAAAVDRGSHWWPWQRSAWTEARLHCADSAREAARAAARDQPVPKAGSEQITVVRQGQTETATAAVRLHPLGWLPTITVVESATAAVEPGVTAP